MKKSIFLLAALMMTAFIFSGCAKDNGANNANNNSNENFAVDADKNIDMSKVEGIDATTANDENASGEVGETKVKITDAKVIKYNEKNVIVFSFEFTNNTGEETTFAAMEKVTAEQNGTHISLTTVVDVEGIDCNTLAQPVKNGKTITVQKAFRLSNTTDPVTVYVNSPDAVTDGGAVSKTFNIQ